MVSTCVHVFCCVSLPGTLYQLDEHLWTVVVKLDVLGCFCSRRYGPSQSEPNISLFGGMEAEEKLSSASHDNEMLGIMASLGPSMLTTVEPV